LHFAPALSHGSLSNTSRKPKLRARHNSPFFIGCLPLFVRMNVQPRLFNSLVKQTHSSMEKPMKRLKTITAISLTTVLASPLAFADKKQTIQDAKSGATFFTAAIAGGVAGGPIGFILGGLGGAYLADQGQQKLEQEIQLELANMNTSQLEMLLDEQNLEIGQLEAMIAEKMQFQMYFKTGQAALNKNDETQLQALADFLKENDYMHITIDGHADPRGEPEYNLTLSETRADAVARILKENGIEDYRMHLKGHGSSFSNAALGSIDEYAQERRVNIQVFPSKDSANLANIN